jgi:putative chitinase
MKRKLLLWIVVSLLTVGVLLCLGPLSALAAPPPPAAPPAPEPTAFPIPPAPPPGYAVYHVVQWGENLTRIALRYGTTVWAIAQANGIWNINFIRAGQVLLIPVPGPTPKPPPRVYIVQRGDTLSAIAWRFGTTVWAIAQANGIWNSNLIYIGQTLYIP